MFQRIKIHSTNRNAITQAQCMLDGLGYRVTVDGDFGRNMEAAVVDFQWENQLVMDGMIGEKTWKVLMLIASHYLDEASGQYLSESDLILAASRLDIELAAIKALNEVESCGSGFLNNFPKVLFDSQVFWKRLMDHGVEPEIFSVGNADIVNQQGGGYCSDLSEVKRLQRAKAIHEEAALESASWGQFQIMGHHWKALKYKSVEDFTQRMMISEAEQLEALVRYIRYNRLDKWLCLTAGQSSLELQNFEMFVNRYHDSAHIKNNHHIRMFTAYKKYRAEIVEELIQLSDAA